MKSSQVRVENSFNMACLVAVMKFLFNKVDFAVCGGMEPPQITDISSPD
ncbi:MAG: hypothetical protein P2A85_04155 [Microcoleus anatoxicus]